MLVDRGEAISHFKKEKYYHVRLDLSGAEAASERISDKAGADTLKAACEAETASETLLLSSVRETSGAKSAPSIKGNFPDNMATVFAAVSSMSSVRNALSVRG